MQALQGMDGWFGGQGDSRPPLLCDCFLSFSQWSYLFCTKSGETPPPRESRTARRITCSVPGTPFILLFTDLYKSLWDPFRNYLPWLLLTRLRNAEFILNLHGSKRIQHFVICFYADVHVMYCNLRIYRGNYNLPLHKKHIGNSTWRLFLELHISMNSN